MERFKVNRLQGIPIISSRVRDTYARVWREVENCSGSNVNGSLNLLCCRTWEAQNVPFSAAHCKLMRVRFVPEAEVNLRNLNGSYREAVIYEPCLEATWGDY